MPQTHSGDEERGDTGQSQKLMAKTKQAADGSITRQSDFLHKSLTGDQADFTYTAERKSAKRSAVI